MDSPELDTCEPQPWALDLALQAITTPLAHAPSALEVLVDQLLEWGTLTDSPLQAFFTPEAWRVRQRENALEWARRWHTPFPPPIDLASIAPPWLDAFFGGVTVDTASGKRLDSVANALFGVYRRWRNGVPEESDAELRARLRERLRAYVPGVVSLDGADA